MNEQDSHSWEQHIHQTAASYRYPQTPNIAAGVRLKLAEGKGRPGLDRLVRLAWILVAIILLLSVLMAVPQVRAAVLRAIRIGAITIFETNEGETPPLPGSGVPAATPAAPSLASAVAPLTATPAGAVAQSPAQASPTLDFFDVTDFATEVSLEEAMERVPFSWQLPSYPPDLGLPNRVYIQRGDGPLTAIFLWQEKPSADQSEPSPSGTGLALYAIGADQYAYKGAKIVRETVVGNQPAFWIEGPHLIFLQQTVRSWRFVPGSVLVWWADSGLTYRLEGAASLQEAVRIAESMAPVPR